MQQKSNAKMASAILIRTENRIREMVEVLDERENPLAVNINRLLKVNLHDLADKLVELPERAQYIISQIENLSRLVDELIQDIENFNQQD